MKKKTLARLILMLILAIMVAGLAVILTSSTREISCDVLDLQVIPERRTPTGTQPQQYWMYCRVITDGTVEYYWVPITRQQFVRLCLEGQKHEKDFSPRR